MEELRDEGGWKDRRMRVDGRIILDRGMRVDGRMRGDGRMTVMEG